MSRPEILTHFGKVQIPTIKVDEAESAGLSHYRIETKYINNTQKVVRLKLRSNMEMTIPAVPQHTEHTWHREFLVRHEFVVSATMAEQMYKYFLNLPENDTGVLAAFRKVYLKVYETFRSPFIKRELRCAVDYVFSEDDLNAAGGMFYHDELDTLFKFGDEPFAAAHPHSFAGRKLEKEDAVQTLHDSKGFIFWVEIIDNLGKYGDRYLPICNQVFKIPARTDKNRPDGLYIVSSKPTNGKINPDEISTKFYPFEDVEKELGIYATYENALCYGDVVLQRKAELAALEHEIAKERKTFAQDKQRYEAELEDKNRKVRELEHERTITLRAMEDLRAQQTTLLDMEKLRLKDHYERRGNDRKDTSELIKFVPLILTGIATVLMWIKTFKPT